MLFNPEDVVLISHRRVFEQDEPRFMLGRVLAYEDALIKVEGYSFIRDLSTGMFVRKKEKRVKVISLHSAGSIVYQLPADVHLDQATIRSVNGQNFLVDGIRELLNVSERVHGGRM